jgi:hypothetical protein
LSEALQMVEKEIAREVLYVHFDAMCTFVPGRSGSPIWLTEAAMRRHVFMLPAVVAVLAACAPPAASPPPSSAPASSSPSTAAPSVPPAPEPSGGGPCPYLGTDFVAQSNGQRVSKVRTSVDKPYPSCFFYALDGSLQLTVRVYVGEPAVATALVDQVAPIATSNPAAEPAGWRGGYEAIDSGAVYAVAKQGAAVVVTTDQNQSIKARTVAKQAIAGLKL